MKIYLVGGALRDELLDLPVVERDWVVVGATQAEMLNLGYRPVEGDFPVFLHPDTHEEYALARRELKIAPGHRGFQVEFGPDVTLEEDLARRDLTINAMARDGQGGIVDPYGGRDDLDNGRLRHVTPAFVEDPLRLLRVARFAAKLGRWGFRLAHGTHRLMEEMAASGELQTLSQERVWRETAKALAADTPSRYFDVLRRCGALVELFPELTSLGSSSGHGEDRGPDDKVLIRLDRSAASGYDPGLRLAVLLAHVEPAVAERLLRRMSPRRADADWVRLYHQCSAVLTKVSNGASFMDLVECCDALRRPKRLEGLVRIAQLTDRPLDEPLRSAIADALDAVGGIQATQWIAAGLRGAELGETLRKARVEAAQRYFEK
ncbi:MAG: multifunctional CCA tRNA nucleotidyl transferase/2'3'-cyclic phosphodiesterase/2'nucleotidase/phosphatase [Chromatiales bacterium]|nr:multifunctional CCA tRNA nucleotidyl transferase/2'3'-cyclic phosphodiesterase/2'nucleotidase/phosphatase [Chromatiales bacterium]